MFLTTINLIYVYNFNFILQRMHFGTDNLEGDGPPNKRTNFHLFPAYEWNLFKFPRFFI